MSVRRSLLFPARALAVLSLATLGCSGPLAPPTRPATVDGPAADTRVTSGAETALASAPSQPGFYPLTVGNRWDYRVTTVFRLIPDAGDPSPPQFFQALVRREIVGAERLEGHEYLVELTTWDDSSTPAFSTVLSRQDATGLYEFEAQRFPVRTDGATYAVGRIRAEMPPAMERLLARRPPEERAALRLAADRLAQRISALGSLVRTAGPPGARLRLPGTARPYELTRLRYPLETKAGWTIRTSPGPPFEARVIRAETLDLPAGRLRGYRIRLGSGWFGPDDAVEVWYGASGYLQSLVHAESDAADETGNVIGRWTFDQREMLVDLRLAATSVVALPPGFTPPRK